MKVIDMSISYINRCNIDIDQCRYSNEYFDKVDIVWMTTTTEVISYVNKTYESLRYEYKL
jgi:hypothetical protein